MNIGNGRQFQQTIAIPVVLIKTVSSRGLWFSKSADCIMRSDSLNAYFPFAAMHLFRLPLISEGFRMIFDENQYFKPARRCYDAETFWPLRHCL
jgi:hypothetical protein